MQSCLSSNEPLPLNGKIFFFLNMNVSDCQSPPMYEWHPFKFRHRNFFVWGVIGVLTVPPVSNFILGVKTQNVPGCERLSKHLYTPYRVSTGTVDFDVDLFLLAYTTPTIPNCKPLFLLQTFYQQCFQSPIWLIEKSVIFLYLSNHWTSFFFQWTLILCIISNPLGVPNCHEEPFPSFLVHYIPITVKPTRKWTVRPALNQLSLTTD
jgi:hypothetical protein